jgi:hypothetical protein
MTSKFEQLIEYVINDEEAKAKELFHDIVVEKSREIYENLMNEESEEELDEAMEEDSEEELDEAKEEDEEGEELDESEEDLDENMMGGDAADNLIDDVEAEEEGMEMHEDDKVEHDIEDRVVDLEDKLDELMAEFESLMGGEEHSDSVSDIDGGDALEMDDTETAEFGHDGEEESDSEELDMMENVKLDAAPKPTTTEPAGTNTKSTVAFNSGAKGMQGAPVKMTGDTAQGRSAPKSGDLPEAGQFKNVPGKGGSNAKLAPAPKPVTAQASGVNTKTPFPKG